MLNPLTAKGSFMVWGSLFIQVKDHFVGDIGKAELHIEGFPYFRGIEKDLAALECACFFHESGEDFSGDASAPELRAGIHIEQAGASAVGDGIAWGVDMQTDPPCTCKSSFFFGDDAHIGAVSDGAAEILDIGIEEHLFIFRWRERFSFPAHTDAHFPQKPGIINSCKAEIHVSGPLKS